MPITPPARRRPARGRHRSAPERSGRRFVHIDDRSVDDRALRSAAAEPMVALSTTHATSKPTRPWGML
jgi:hypothetical protein